MVNKQIIQIFLGKTTTPTSNKILINLGEKTPIDNVKNYVSGTYKHVTTPKNVLYISEIKVDEYMFDFLSKNFERFDACDAIEIYCDVFFEPILFELCEYIRDMYQYTNIRVFATSEVENLCEVVDKMCLD